MSRRIVASRNVPPVEVLQSLLAAQCPDCDADYVLREDETDSLIWRLDVAHDDTCPMYLGILD